MIDCVRGFIRSAPRASVDEITFVETEQHRAMTAMGVGGVAQGGDLPVYLIQLRGDFIIRAPMPHGRPYPSGSIAYLIVSRRTGRLIGRGVADRDGDLTALGEPRRLVLPPSPAES